MFIFPSVSLTPAGTGNTMSLVGVYRYGEFAAAPLQTGDFAVYLSNFPNTSVQNQPTGGSGDRWVRVGGSNYGYLSQKVLTGADIGVQPTNGRPTYDTDSRFIVYRGPGSLLFRTQAAAGTTMSYVKNVKHCGMLAAYEKNGASMSVNQPQTWVKRREQNVNWSGATLTTIGIYDRMEPANTVYVDSDPITSSIGPGGVGTIVIYEFLIP